MSDAMARLRELYGEAASRRTGCQDKECSVCRENKKNDAEFKAALRDLEAEHTKHADPLARELAELRALIREASHTSAVARVEQLRAMRDDIRRVVECFDKSYPSIDDDGDLIEAIDEGLRKHLPPEDT